MATKFKPHRGSASHPAYSLHGVKHPKHMQHHPGKTSPHPSDPHMSEAGEGVDESMGLPPAGGPGPEAGTDTDQ